MMSGKVLCLLLVLIIAMVTSSQTVEDTGCVEGCDGQDEGNANNKFALLFRQMLAKQREVSMDCASTEDCPDALECISNKCRAIGPRRTKIINLYSRW